MVYSDEAYVLMLLCTSLSADKEEYAHPLSAKEIAYLRAQMRFSPYCSFGSLIGEDIAALMKRLMLEENEAVRIYTLLNRGLQLSYAIDRLMEQGIDIMTSAGSEYPDRLRQRLNDDAPPMFYFCGNLSLLNKPMLSLNGITGVKTGQYDRNYIEKLVCQAKDNGYVILTGGEPGINRYAFNCAVEYGVDTVTVLGGNLSGYIKDEYVSDLINNGKTAVVSAEHPDALFTVSHALSRNRILYALSEAAFVFNTDERRGETEALRNKLCDWIYISSDMPLADTFLSKGAALFPDIESLDIEMLSKLWASGRAEQMNFFDLLNT